MNGSECSSASETSISTSVPGVDPIMDVITLELSSSLVSEGSSCRWILIRCL